MTNKQLRTAIKARTSTAERKPWVKQFGLPFARWSRDNLEEVYMSLRNSDRDGEPFVRLKPVLEKVPEAIHLMLGLPTSET